MKNETRLIRLGLPVVGVVAALLLSGCTSEGDGGGSTSDQDLSAFQTVVDEAMQPWMEWNGPDETPAPPKDIELALVTCAGVVAGCVLPAEAAQEAAEALGWKTTMYDGQGDPVVQNNVVTQAITSGADAILMAGVDPAQIGSALELAEEQGIPVGSMTQGIEAGNGIAFDIGADYVQSGAIMGSWIAVDSGGTAVVLPTNDKEFASTVAIVDSAIDTLGDCDACEVKDTEYFVGSDIGNGLGDRIAQILQREASVNYVIGAFDPAVADMVPAINNAGIGDRVKIISNVGLTQNLEFIADGDVQAADIVYDNTSIGYAAVDQIIRLLTGNPLFETPGVTDPRFIYNQGAPQHLMTAGNLDDPSVPWTADNDAVSRYRTLWGLS
jgi:ABC-type sugar transport system substrate-binding protein